MRPRRARLFHAINVSKYERKGKFALKIPAVLGLTAPSVKAAEDSRTPRPRGRSGAQFLALVPRTRKSAAVLCRFDYRCLSMNQASADVTEPLTPPHPMRGGRRPRGI